MTELQLSCSKGDTSFQQQLHPRTSLGFVHQQTPFPDPPALLEHLDTTFVREIHCSAAWQQLFPQGWAGSLLLSVYAHPSIWFPCPLRGATGSGFFFSFLNLLFDTFQQGSPNLPVFMPHLHIMRSFNNA